MESISHKNKQEGTGRKRSINQIRKYVWLIRVLLRHPHGMTYDELNDAWRETSEDFDGSSNLSKKTLHNWITAIKEVFNIYIENENRSEYRYSIDKNEIEDDEILEWMINTISVGSMLHGLRDRVLLTDKPSGNDQLETLLEAMERNRTVTVEYHDIWKKEAETFELEPYWVELANQRWYVVGHRVGTGEGELSDFSVDRMERITVSTDKSFVLPKDQDGDAIEPRRHYAKASGLETDGMTNVKVRLYAEANQQNYIRTLPLHPSQDEAIKEKDFSIFEYTLPTVTYDFIMKILSYTPYVIVLEPKQLANEIAWRAQLLDKRYNG